jgi:hypothetical protein
LLAPARCAGPAVANGRAKLVLIVVRQDSNVQVISGKFLGDFQRHYDEKGYKIFDWILDRQGRSCRVREVLSEGKTDRMSELRQLST